jgi:hypothetical protein
MKEQNQRQTSPAYPRVRAKRKVRARLTLRDAEDFAQLAAMRLSEAECCATLNIPVRTWRDWKARHNHEEVFREIFDRIRGERITAHLQNIAKFSEKDWRASECYLEKTEPGRFASRALAFPEQPQVNVTVNALYIEASRRVYGEPALKPPAPTCKALPAPTPEEMNASVKDYVDTLKPAGPLKP